MAFQNHPAQHIVVLAVWIHLISSYVMGASDVADALLMFKSSIGNNASLRNWVAGSNPCPSNGARWVGVLCIQGHVWGIQLENMGLTGPLDIDPLVGLPALRTLSFQNNSFSGPIPNIRKIGPLKSVFLSKNNFSGEIPDDAFDGMESLKKVFLWQNQFSGPIPASLARLPRLLELRLEENQFQGKIPNFQQRGLRRMNVSYNDLEGHIPPGLSKLDSSSFIGNTDLCGDPLETPCKSRKKVSTGLLIGLIVIIVAVVLAIIAAIAFLFHRRRRRSSSPHTDVTPSTGQNKVTIYDEDHLERGSPANGSGNNEKRIRKEKDLGRLTFVREVRERFELQDLLKASAEVLGNGNFGSSYKAMPAYGPPMVVKRFREMNGVERQDFEDHMRRLGGLNHPNLVPLLAFYYRKEEKLLVTDFVANGSLGQVIHGKPSDEGPPLDWSKRLNIVKGVARGLAYLYNALPSLTLPHGHLKSSNVLLNETFEPLLTDYSLEPVMNKEHATQLMVAYKSPKHTLFHQVTRKSDVWSLGILILEILTGKFPEDNLEQGKGTMDLASWVHSVMREEGKGEIFDSQMEWSKNSEGEMLKLLQIGLACCEKDVEKRWDLREALGRIEELRETRSDEESPFVSEGEVYFSSRSKGLSIEDISLSTNH